MSRTVAILHTNRLRNGYVRIRTTERVVVVRIEDRDLHDSGPRGHKQSAKAQHFVSSDYRQDRGKEY